jgi:hypothetical protein
LLTSDTIGQGKVTDTDTYFSSEIFKLLRRPGIDSANLRSLSPYCKRLRSLGIDSEGSIPPAYVAWQAGTTNRVVVPARQAGNRYLGSLKGLQIRTLAGRYDFPIPTRFLALIDCSKIPAQFCGLSNDFATARLLFMRMRIVKYCACVPTCLVETYMTLDTDSLSFRHIKQLDTISTTPIFISSYGFLEKISWLEQAIIYLRREF